VGVGVISRAVSSADIQMYILVCLSLASIFIDRLVYDLLDSGLQSPRVASPPLLPRAVSLNWTYRTKKELPIVAPLSSEN